MNVKKYGYVTKYANLRRFSSWETSTTVSKKQKQNKDSIPTPNIAEYILSHFRIMKQDACL